mgnify:FL=1
MRLGTNHLSGTLEPLRSCTALHGLGLACNHLTGSLEPLQDCKALNADPNSNPDPDSNPDPNLHYSPRALTTTPNP